MPPPGFDSWTAQPAVSRCTNQTISNALDTLFSFLFMTTEVNNLQYLCELKNTHFVNILLALSLYVCLLIVLTL